MRQSGYLLFLQNSASLATNWRQMQKEVNVDLMTKISSKIGLCPGRRGRSEKIREVCGDQRRMGDANRPAGFPFVVRAWS
jgi:hypothetical protein